MHPWICYIRIIICVIRAQMPWVNEYVNDVCQEFLVHLIHRERSKAEELLAAKEGSIKLIEMSRELLTDPLIFLRKWLGEVCCLEILTCMSCVTLFTSPYIPHFFVIYVPLPRLFTLPYVSDLPYLTLYTSVCVFLPCVSFHFWYTVPFTFWYTVLCNSWCALPFILCYVRTVHYLIEFTVIFLTLRCLILIYLITLLS